MISCEICVLVPRLHARSIFIHQYLPNATVSHTTVPTHHSVTPTQPKLLQPQTMDSVQTVLSLISFIFLLYIE